MHMTERSGFWFVASAMAALPALIAASRLAAG